MPTMAGMSSLVAERMTKVCPRVLMFPVNHQTLGATTSPGESPLETIEDDLQPEPEAHLAVRSGHVARDGDKGARRRTSREVGGGRETGGGSWHGPLRRLRRHRPPKAPRQGGG